MRSDNLFQRVDNSYLFNEIIKLRQSVYCKRYPKVDIDSYDIHDYFCSIWLGRNKQGEIISTSRLVTDGSMGLPSEEYIKNYIHSFRCRGIKLAEFGRLISIEKTNFTRICDHFYHAYLEAKNKNIDAIVLVTSIANRYFYESYIGASVICKDIGENFGSDDTFALYIWEIKKTKNKLLKHKK